MEPGSMRGPGVGPKGSMREVPDRRWSRSAPLPENPPPEYAMPIPVYHQRHLGHQYGPGSGSGAPMEPSANARGQAGDGPGGAERGGGAGHQWEGREGMRKPGGFKAMQY
ncbi:unnamed protein product, partial [Discosporangium mesarthrocarpum]